MVKGKVHETRSVDGGRGMQGGPPLASGDGVGRRQEDRDPDVRPDELVGESGGRQARESEAEPVAGGDWLSLRGDAGRLRSASQLDPEPGQQTTLSIDRRLKELVALSQRNDEALTCVVFGVDAVANNAHVTTEAMAAAAERFGMCLRRQTRRTDIVGRLDPLTHIVLAPRTPPFGGLRLAERFTSMSVSWFLAGESPVTFGAGVAGVEGRGGDLESRPDSLVDAARRALADARMAGAAQISAAWLDV